MRSTDDEGMDNAGFREALPDELGRRVFLRGAAASACAAAAAVYGWPRWGMPIAMSEDGLERSLVVQVRSDHVITTRGVHEGLLFDLLQSLLKHLTDSEDEGTAWARILQPDDKRIVLKFNQSIEAGLGTTTAMGRALVRSMREGGIDRSRITGVGMSAALIKNLGIQAPPWGWSDAEHDFGSGKDRLAAWVEDADAIVNVPVLMDHNIAGMSCGLMNLSHEAVKHPAQFYDNGCSPYIGDIVAMAPIRDRLRLTLVNAIRVIFEGGPEAREEYIWDAGTLFGGRDPVAVDAIGLQLLNHVRAELKLPTIGDKDGGLPYLRNAEKRGLGTSRLYEIRAEKIKL